MRVSTQQEEQESSYEAQIDYYTKYITNHPYWELMGVFADKGITGTNTKNREQFKRMIELALEQKIDLIITKSISRFARNTLDTLQTVRQLKPAKESQGGKEENFRGIKGHSKAGHREHDCRAGRRRYGVLS